MKRTVFSFLLIAAAVLISRAFAADLEFEGTPTTKVEVLEGTSQSTPVSRLDATSLRVVIVREGDKYLWQSRKGLPLSKSISGAYVTYIALNGAGYVRVLSPEMRRLREQLPAAERENALVYMEHLVNQLGSVTYFGK